MLGTAGLAVEPVITAIRAHGPYLEPFSLPMDVDVHDTTENHGVMSSRAVAIVGLGSDVHNAVPPLESVY